MMYGAKYFLSAETCDEKLTEKNSAPKVSSSPDVQITASCASHLMKICSRFSTNTYRQFLLYPVNRNTSPHQVEEGWLGNKNAER